MFSVADEADTSLERDEADDSKQSRGLDTGEGNYDTRSEASSGSRSRSGSVSSTGSVVSGASGSRSASVGEFSHKMLYKLDNSPV